MTYIPTYSTHEANNQGYRMIRNPYSIYYNDVRCSSFDGYVSTRSEISGMSRSIRRSRFRSSYRTSAHRIRII